MTNHKLFAVISLFCLSLAGVELAAQTTTKKRIATPAKKAPSATNAQAQTAPKKITESEAKLAEPSVPSQMTQQPPAVLTNVLREVDYIVALVNSEPITRNELRLRQTRLLAQWAAQGVTPPSESEIFKRALEQLIDERVIQQIAKDDGVRISDAQLDDAMLIVARQNQFGGLAELRKDYEKGGGNWNSYREEFRAEIARAQVRDREVNARVRVSESEIDQALQEQNAGSNAASRGAVDINLAQILIALPDNPTASEVLGAKTKADKVLAEARKGADFAKLAEQNSDAADKAKGGVMGLRAASRYPELFAATAQKLKLDEVSDIQRSDAGFHILKLLERQSTSTATVTQSRVRHILLPLTDKLNEAQAKAQLSGYKSQIESGRANFASLAREHSVDGSAAGGGDLGWTTPGLFVPEFERVMSTLPIGKISEPFTSRFGAHILEVVDRKAVAISVREQRDAMRNQLREKKSGDAYTLWITDARARAFVEYKNVAQ
jgi:peptidyl-prolyl cis-trans isomerase SurA